jgi:hypothetical protein
MKIASRMAVMVAAASSCIVAWSQTPWPDFMSKLEPGLSTSPVIVVLPPDIVVQAPAADLPPDKARWSGKWRGWACRDQTCDTRLIVEKVNASGASIIYAFASADLKPSILRAEAKFVGEELQATFRSGAKIAYRFRKDSGDIEYYYQRDSGWVAGVLSKEK